MKAEWEPVWKPADYDPQAFVDKWHEHASEVDFPQSEKPMDWVPSFATFQKTVQRTRGAAGAGAIHRLTTPRAPWQPTAPPKEGADGKDRQRELVRPQAAADHSLEGWEAIRGDEYDRAAPLCWPPTDIEKEEYRIPPITPKEAMDASGEGRGARGGP